MKNCINLYKRNKELFFLFASIVTELLMFVPDVITMLFRVLFILYACIDLAKSRFVIRLGKVEKIFGATIVLFFFQTLFSPYMSVEMLLAVCQMFIVNFLILIQKEEKLQESLYTFLFIIEKITLCGILYSAFLLAFGQTRRIDGQWINYFITPAIGQVGHGMQGHLGFSSFFTNPNPFAFFIAVVLVWKTINCNVNSLRWWISIFIHIIGMRIADSRAGDICGVVGILIVLYLKFTNRKQKKLVLFIAVIIGTVCLLFSWNRIPDLLGNIDLAGRAEKWNLLIAAFKKSPLIGSGYSSSRKVILKGISNGTFTSYLTIAAEEGLLGIIACAISYIAIIWNSSRRCIQYPRNSLIMFGMVYIIQLGILGIVEDVFFNVTSRFLILEIIAKISINSQWINTKN